MKNQISTVKLPSSIKKQLESIQNEFDSKKTKKNQQQIDIVFAICLISKTVSRDWDGVKRNLGKTIRSILNNSDPNFRVIIAGHEKPAIKEIDDSRVTWLAVDFPPPTDSKGFSGDRKHKRRVIGAYLRKIGFSGYFMPLDADDWIHYRFVEYIRSFPISDAFIMNKGYMVNQANNEMWVRDRFYRGCGSSAVYYFLNEDFPKSADIKDARKTTFNVVLKAHRLVVENLEEVNKSFTMIDFPLVTYFIGHGENWSVVEGKRDDDISATNYKTKGQKVDEWFYQYFKVKD